MIDFWKIDFQGFYSFILSYCYHSSDAKYCRFVQNEFSLKLTTLELLMSIATENA